MPRPLFSQPSLRSICSQCRQSPLPPASRKRFFTTTTPKLADSDISSLSELSKAFQKAPPKQATAANSASYAASTDPLQYFPQASDTDIIKGWRPPPPPHHLHVYCHRHNTHITLTDGQRQPVISVSAGNIGFRKAARGTYDAAYQLGAYVMSRIQAQGLLAKIQSMEVILRDFGPGREAVTKILLGSEGRNIRSRITRVMDATRLKFGGTRGKKPRRIG